MNVRLFITSIAENTTIYLESSPYYKIEAGNDVTFTCSVILPSEVTDTPHFEWEGPGITTTTTDNAIHFGQEAVSEYTVHRIATYQTGLYSCFVSLHGNISTNMTISVESNENNILFIYILYYIILFLCSSITRFNY